MMNDSDKKCLGLTFDQIEAINEAFVYALNPVNGFFAIMEDCQTTATNPLADWDTAGEVGRILMKHADMEFHKALGID